jgi:hypothetical protein
MISSVLALRLGRDGDDQGLKVHSEGLGRGATFSFLIADQVADLKRPGGIYGSKLGVSSLQCPSRAGSSEALSGFDGRRSLHAGFRTMPIRRVESQVE